MAGPDPDNPLFAEEFHADIGAVMMMGLPQDPALRPIFHFDGGREYLQADSAGNPWDWTAAPTDPEPPDPVVAGDADDEVLLAIEPREGETDETTAGTFEADEYIFYFLDDQWPKVEAFTWCLLGGRRFKRTRTLNPIGLFDVTVHQVRVEADPDA